MNSATKIIIFLHFSPHFFEFNILLLIYVALLSSVAIIFELRTHFFAKKVTILKEMYYFCNLIA